MHKLISIGFEYIEFLDVYQLRESSDYGANVVQIEIKDSSMNMFLTDYTSDWCRKNARKAITAMGKEGK